MAAGFVPFQGHLTVGDNTGGFAVAQLASGKSDQIPDTALTTVLGDGQLDLNHQNDIIIEVHVLEGLVTTGTGSLTVTAMLNQDGDVNVADGHLAVSFLDMDDGRVTLTGVGLADVFNLDMTGGRIDLVDATTELTIVNVAATASSVPALITGAGIVELGTVARTFTVGNNASVPTDLQVTAPLVSTGGGGALIKAGAGTLELDSDANNYDGGTRVDAGILQVDGTIGNVMLNGGTLSGDDGPGAGTVGVVTTGSGGAVAPGNSPGTLHVQGNATLDDTVTFFVELNDGSPTATAGVDYDQLLVNGIIDLNLAGIDGDLGGSVDVGDSFVIITSTSAVQGQFAQGAFAFIDGNKFDIQYNPPSHPTSVVLTRIKNTATVEVISSANPSVWGQSVVFTAIVTPEPNTGPIADGTPFVFTISGPGITGSVDFPTTLTGSQATFDPVASGVLAGQGLISLEIAPSGGEYLVTGTFLETDDFFEAQHAILQEVRKASTEINVASSLNPSTFGENVTFTADVDILAPGGAVPGTDNLTGGTVTFFLDSVPQTPVPVDSAGIATIAFPSLTVGGHSIRASYSGDSHFNSAMTTGDLAQQVNKADTTTTVIDTPDPADPGQNVTFSVHVASSSGVPTGTVVITDGAEVQRVTINGASGNFTLTFGGHTTAVSLPFNAAASAVEDALNLLPSIGGVDGTVVVVKNLNVYTVTFGGALAGQNLAQMTASGSALPAVTTVSNGGNSFGSTSIDGSGDAAFEIATLPPGVHTIYVNYLGDLNFNPSIGTTTLVVRGFTTMNASSTPNPSSAGQPVDFVVSVAGVAPFTAVPTGDVEFYAGAILPANLIGAGALDSLGQARFDDYTGLAMGTHTINVHYLGDGNYIPNTTSFAHLVKGDTAVGVVVAPSPSIFGQLITITATVSAVSPAFGVPTGTVNFYDGPAIPANLIGSDTLDSGVAVMDISTLGIAVHTINVAYLGDSSFNAGAGSASHTVRGDTTTTVVSSLNPSTFGEQVTFTATVSQTQGAAVPTGTVDFIDDLTATVFGDDVALVDGVASFDFSALSAGTHPIRAVYNGTTAFNGSVGILDPQQVVNQASTSTVLASPTANPTVFGQTVSFTATVSAVAPGAGTPGGSVDFLDGTTVIGDDIPLVGGVATLDFANLAFGAHPNITARYNGTNDFAASTSNALSRTVNKADTTTQLNSTFNPAVYGQTMLTATVTPTAPGGGVPAGTVTFFVTNLATTVETTVSFTGGTATLSPTLDAGTYSIRARFNGSNNYNLSPFSNTINPQIVNKADTTTIVSTTGSPAVFGAAVIRATVAAVAPGAATPIGQVIFHVSGGPSAGDYPATLSGGVAVLPATLSVGSYTITADYPGTPNFNGSSDTAGVAQTVTAASTSVAVSSNHNPSLFGQPLTFTATVSAVAPGAGIPTGTVDFEIDGLIVGDDVALSNGQATLPAVVLPVAGSPHSVVVHYSGSTDFNAASGSLSGGQVVNKANVSGNLLTNSPALLGTTVTFNVSFSAVAPGAGTPGGTADLFIDGIERISNMSLAAGAVSFDVTDAAWLSRGNRSVFVHYDGDANFNAANSNTIVQSIKSNVTVTVDSNNNPSDFGELVRFTATIDEADGPDGTPSGTVDFIIDGNTVASNVPLTGGQATFDTTSINANGSPHSVAVHYDGDAFFFEGDGGPAGGQTVNQVATSVAVASSANPAVFGQPVIITAAISRLVAGAGQPDGTADLLVDGMIVQNVNVVNGVAAFAALTNLNVADSPHSIQVDYLGSGNFIVSSNSLDPAQTVNQVATTTTVTASPPSPSVVEQSVTFVATVAAQAPSVAVPTGFVRFFIDGVPQTPDQPLSGGQASLTTSSLELGMHTVSAQYLGTPDLAASADDLSHQVNPNPVVFTVVPASVKSGAPFTVIVQVRNGADPDPDFNGTVSLGIAGGPAGGFIAGNATVNASGGVAIFSIALPKAGAYNLSATANGLPAVISPPIQSTALGLAAAVTPRRVFVNRLFVINASAFDATGSLATNYNGGFTLSILRKPAGARTIGPRFGALNGGFGQLFLRVNKAGTYLFRLNGPDGLTATIRLVIRGRRSSTR